MTRLRRIALALVVVGCGGGGAGETTAPVTPTTPTSTGNPGASAASISIRGTTDSYGYASYSFDPADVTVSKGATVSWTNSSGATHNIVFDNTAGAPTSVGDFSSGSQTRTFGTAGTFNFHCTHHSGMDGSVVVQ